MTLRYVNSVTLIDATHNTNIYDLLLFMLCVPTNASYITVATFILTDEQTESIENALRLLSSWNPDWKPNYVMSEAQIMAVRNVFPGNTKY